MMASAVQIAIITAGPIALVTPPDGSRASHLASVSRAIRQEFDGSKNITISVLDSGVDENPHGLEWQTCFLPRSR